MPTLQEKQKKMVKSNFCEEKRRQFMNFEEIQEKHSLFEKDKMRASQKQKIKVKNWPHFFLCLQV